MAAILSEINIRIALKDVGFIGLGKMSRGQAAKKVARLIQPRISLSGSAGSSSGGSSSGSSSSGAARLRGKIMHQFSIYYCTMSSAA